MHLVPTLPLLTCPSFASHLTSLTPFPPHRISLSLLVEAYEGEHVGVLRFAARQLRDAEIPCNQQALERA